MKLYHLNFIPTEEQLEDIGGSEVLIDRQECVRYCSRVNEEGCGDSLIIFDENEYEIPNWLVEEETLFSF